jgi:hypothetical protein
MIPLIKIEPILTQPLGCFLMLSAISLTLLSTIQLSLIFLFISFCIDFLSGIYASWIEFKNKKIEINTYLIESKKLRKSISKAIAYMVFIGFVYGIEILFFIKSFSISVSGANLTITLVAIGACIAIEFFSVLENMKRCGFDLLGKISKAAQNVWKIINNVKGQGNDTSE